MVFSSLPFLFVFFPAALALYFLLPGRMKNGALLVISLIFYAWGEPVYVLLMLFSIALDYTCGRMIERMRGGAGARAFLLVSVIGNLGLLGFFKYSGWLVQNVNALLGTAILWEGLPLPIGISFYTFQTMSYTIDVYHGHTAAQRNLVDFGAYVSMFPQLIAGPIVRYTDVAEQLKQRRVTLEGFGQGTLRFIAGLGKKVLLANNIGPLWETVQALPGRTVLAAWLGIFAFAMQIYFDFSGYSDMAIGLGRMLGFDFPENFNQPYRSRSISEFWRRWHMTLGGWFRDYVYFPLGGSRTSRVCMVRNLAIVWLLTGLWHGAEWTFVVWGAYFGLFIILEKLWLGRALARAGKWVGHAYALLVVAVGWALFASPGIAAAGEYIASMFSGILMDGHTAYLLSNYAGLIIVLLAIQLPWGAWLPRARQWLSARGAPLFCALYLIVLLLSIAYLVDAAYNPFLYFRF